jgi:hypothetical protein
MPRHAPASSGASSGSVTACRSGSTTNWAAVPEARPQAAFHTHTRSPTRRESTPAPTASIKPEPSLCGTMRGNGRVFVRVPARDFTSEGFTPDQASRTRTSPAAGSGRGRSFSASTSCAGPVRS